MEIIDDSGVSVHTSKQDEAETSVIASSNPVVFQCSQCDAIVGDSTSWVSANKIMRTITLGRVTSKVGVKSEVQVSHSGVDKGSTFSAVYCISCNEVLGKQYLASPPELDYLRGSFTIQVEKLNSYEVGSAQTSGNSDLADMLNVPSPGYLMARMNKMQYLIVSMNDRIKKLETCLTDMVSGEKTQDAEHAGKMRSCTLGETESVTSSDNFSANPHTYSSGSDIDAFDANYGQSVHYGRQLLVAKPLNEVDINELRKNRGKLTSPSGTNDEIVNRDRVQQQRARSNVTVSRPPTRRLMNDCNVTTMGDQEDPSCDQDREHFRQIQQRQSGRKGRREVAERDQREGIDKSREIRTSSPEQPVTTERMIGSKNTPRSNKGRSPEMRKDGFSSPNIKASMSRNRVSAMETWPSPGVDRKGGDRKKRKLVDMSDCQ